jgi:hypothetical protein
MGEREIKDLRLIYEVFCTHNLDSKNFTNFSAVYIIPCAINDSHGSHVVPNHILLAVKTEFNLAAISYYKRLEELSDCPHIELSHIRSKVNHGYLKENFNSFQKSRLLDKEVNSYLQSRHPDKTINSSLRNKRKISGNKVKIEQINNTKYSIITPFQTQTLTVTQMKEFFSCYSKKLYFNYVSALNSEAFASDKTLEIYLCVFCTGYHLGHASTKADRTFHAAKKFMYRYKLRPHLGEEFLSYNKLTV